MSVKCSASLFIVILMGLLSCKNNDNVFPPATSTGITVINASPDTLNFYLNGTRQNNTSSIYSGSSSGLLLVPAGAQNYQFKKAGQPNVLFSLPLKLSSNTFNSVYLTGESADKAFETVDTIRKADSIFSAVRFVNAAPDAGNLTVTVGDTVKFTSRAFKSSSVFLLTGSGQKKVNVYVGGAAIPQFATTIILQQNLTYTLFAKGLLNGTGAAAFGVGVMVNQIVANQ